MSKSFAAALDDEESKPIGFNLGEGAEFEIERPLPGFPVAKLVSAASDGGTKTISAFLDFFEEVMSPEEFERLRNEANKRRIDLETLVEIGGYVIEEGSGRPTKRRADSSNT